MGNSSARPKNRLRGFLSTATVIGAALFSVSASCATTLTPLPTTYDPVARTMTIGVSVTGAPPSQYPTVTFFEPLGRIPLLSSPRVIDGVALLTFPKYRFGAHHITATYSGGGPVVSFTIEVPVDGWVPTLVESLLSD